MRAGRIIHPELAQAVALLGHSDIFMVVDAGFPIPADTWRIDLGFDEGIWTCWTCSACCARRCSSRRCTSPVIS